MSADWVSEAKAEARVSGKKPETHFSDLDDFVQYIGLIWTRPTTHWCPLWHEHPEAVLRFRALWHAWEHLRLEPGTGTAVWIRDFLDPTMTRLTEDSKSPFIKCSPKHGEHSVHHGLDLVRSPISMSED